MSSLSQLPITELPRERLLRDGIDALSMQELIAILLGTGTRGKSVLILAQELLQHFGGIIGLLEASVEDLMQVKGVGKAKAILLKAALGIALRSAKQMHVPQMMLKSAQQAFELAKTVIGQYKQEVLFVILRDVRGRVVHHEIVGIGTLSEVLVHPREVFYPAVRHRAHSLVMVHNHPSGDPTPSMADFELTKQLLQSSKIMGINLDDHLILGHHTFTSFREKGLLGQSNHY